MKAEDVTHLYSNYYFKDLIEFGREGDTFVTRTCKSAMVDTNYLIQTNEKDIISMFFDKEYEEKISSPLKKQMARLFRSFVEGKITLFFSNSIRREFIYIAPEKKSLVSKYSRYMFQIGSKRCFESYFLDLSSIINLQAKETGYKVDLLDTYSYIVACLTGINYFISADSDVKGIFNYITDIKNKTHVEKIKEIKKLMKSNEALFCISERAFPIKKIIEFLFLSSFSLTIPINIKDMIGNLPKASEKASSVIRLCNMINEIEENFDLIDNDERSLIQKAQELIHKICEEIDSDVQKLGERISIPNLHVHLIEKDTMWHIPEELDKFSDDLLIILGKIEDQLYTDEEEQDYKDLEEYFNDSLFTLQPIVKCKCGNEFEDWIYYGGVVAKETREMGAESLHVWNNEVECPACKEEETVEVQLWEYPWGTLNSTDFESNFKILNFKEISRKIGIIL